MKQISDNEIYLLIKYIKSVLCSVAKCLSCIEDARCLKANILGGNVHTVKENTEALVVVNKSIGLEVNADTSKHTVTSRDQNAGQ